MHDIRRIRENPQAFDAAMKKRSLEPVSDQILHIDQEKRQFQTQLQEKQSQRKSLAADIGKRKKQGQDSEDLQQKGQEIRHDIETLERKVEACSKQLRHYLVTLPNILEDSVPDGKDERENVVQHVWGRRREFSFKPKQHFEIGEKMGLMDFKTAAKISGSRFVVLRGALARLSRALGSFMLEMQIDEHGYTEMSVPLLVDEQAMFGTDKLPKFADQSFQTKDGRWLIPTAEVPLTASVASECLNEEQLPMRRTALSQCFRSEAGAAGRDVRGMIRQHQFAKVEMVSITTPDESDAELERMTRCAEMVLERLDIPYRRVLLCAGDTGFGAAKTYDLEVWLPGQNAWREVSSCSTTRDFQARRMNARYRPISKDGGKTKPAFVHTLNGSGLAVGRVLVALMENFQNEDGSITIPSALSPFTGGMTRIAADV